MKSHQSPWARFVIMIAVLVFSLTPSFPASALTPTADIDIALTGSASRNSAPVIMDFDNDGTPEIVLAGEDGTLYLINGVTNLFLVDSSDPLHIVSVWISNRAGVSLKL